MIRGMSLFSTMVIILLLGCINESKLKIDQNITNQKENYFTFWFNKLKADSVTDSVKREILKNLEIRIDELDDKKLKNSCQLKLSYNYLVINDSLKFRESNSKAKNLAIKIGDSLAIAATNWDLGDFFQSHGVKDSAYYFYNYSQKIYLILNEKFSAGRVLLNMAIIQKNIKDYTGSEITTTKVIRLLKPLNKNEQLYKAYNNLGIVFNELENYNQALKYYEEAEYYLKKEHQTNLFPSLWNNVGIVYNNSKRYELANEYFKNALTFKDSIVRADEELHAMLLDNYSYNRFKNGDTIGVLPALKSSLKIRRSNNLTAGEIINKIHLAEYYLIKKDTLSSIRYLNEAKDKSIKSQNTRDILKSLNLLSNLDNEYSLEYAREYIKLSDSLYKEERSTRNKFARIRFETEEYISKSQKLSDKVTKISIIALSILLIISLIYIILFIRSRNKEIRLMMHRQKANSEIYQLTLAQKKIFEEGKEREKLRMSRELHDGVLGKLFGIYLSLDSLNDQDSLDAVKKRKGYINELNIISNEIRAISHELSLNDTYEMDFKTLLVEFLQKIKNVKLDYFIDEKIQWDEIQDEVKMNFYKILLEGFYNIRKHSQATEITFKIELYDKNLKLKITDNGKGFNPKKTYGGIGLDNMKSRAKTIGAKFLIFSSNQGTIIELLYKLN